MFEMDLRARFEFDVYILVELYGVVVRVVFEMRVVVMVMVMRVRRVPEDIGFVMMDFDGKFALCLVQEGCQTVGVVNAIELNPFLRCQFDLKSGTTREKKEIKQIIRGECVCVTHLFCEFFCCLMIQHETLVASQLSKVDHCGCAIVVVSNIDLFLRAK